MNILTSSWPQLLLLIIIYAIVSVLVSTYYYLMSEDNNIKDGFLSYLISSVISILLLPLFLNSIGNNVLERYLKGDYSAGDVFELVAFTVVAALAGKKIITHVLDSLKLNEVKNEMADQRKSLDTYKKEQTNIIIRQVQTDISQLVQEGKEGYYDFLMELKESNSEKCPTQPDKRKQTILELEEKKYINVYGSLDNETVSCSLTRLGDEYLKQALKNKIAAKSVDS